MARPLRIQYPGAWYHVMNRGACRADVFRDRNDRLVFLSLLAEVCRKTGATVHAYCLMGNHFHLLIQTPNANLDEVMRLLSGEYARKFNDKYGKDGGLCRGRYRAILVDSERYLLNVSRYIHRNPAIFQLPDLSDYRWSSYPAYLGLRPAEDWLDLSETLKLVGGRSKYEALVESPLPSEIDHIYERAHLPSILGSSEFKQAARAKGSGAIR